MARSGWVALAMGFGLALASAASGQGGRGEDPLRPLAPEQLGVGVGVTGRAGDPLPLSLANAIALGIENNLDVEVVRHDPPIADLDYRAAWALHEPVLDGGFSFASNESPRANPLQVEPGAAPEPISQTRTLDGDIGLSALIPKLGWRWDVTYTGNETESDQPILFSLNPQFTADLTASFTFPIARGFLWGEEWVQVKTTGIGRGVALHQFRQQLMDTVREIEDAYWGVVARKQDLEVALKSLETARALLDQTRAQYEVGVVSRVEVTEAEAGMADREFRLIEAENDYRTTQDVLVDRVLGRKLRPGSQYEVVPEDAPEQYADLPVDVEVASQRALELRPELEVLRQQIDQQAIQVKFARNQRLPQVDLVGSVGFNGLAGRPRPPAPGDGDGDGGFGGDPAAGFVGQEFFDADDDFFTNEGADSHSVGFQVSIPLGNTRARSEHRLEKLRLRRLGVERVRLEQAIIVEVRAAIRDLRSALQGIRAAERAVDAAREQLRAEQIRLEQGESTPFDVLEREEDMVQAETALIAALEVYHNSVAALDRAQGTILRDRNVVVEKALRRRY